MMLTVQNEYHKKGLLCENIVAQYFKNLGWQLANHRLKTPFAEVDLLFQKQENDPVGKQKIVKKWLMVEVKSLSTKSLFSDRLSWRQKNRLLRAFLYLQSNIDASLEFKVVFVENNHHLQIHDFSDF